MTKDRSVVIHDLQSRELSRERIVVITARGYTFDQTGEGPAHGIAQDQGRLLSPAAQGRRFLGDASSPQPSPKKSLPKGDPHERHPRT
jgi:hypothetical protein